MEKPTARDEDTGHPQPFFHELPDARHRLSLLFFLDTSQIHREAPPHDAAASGNMFKKKLLDTKLYTCMPLDLAMDTSLSKNIERERDTERPDI